VNHHRESVLCKVGEETKELKNDLVYIFAGGELPTSFLQKAGIEITKRFGHIVKKHYVKALRTYLIFMLALLAGSGYAQLSPGDLTDAHAKWEGMSNCTQCHDLGNKVTNAKCLECHKEMKTLDQQEARLPCEQGGEREGLFTCHSEHHGRKFEMVRFDEKTFDHGLTGYPLWKVRTNPSIAAIAINRIISRTGDQSAQRPSSEWMRLVYPATRISIKAPCPANA
jgi:hypothetical protein